MNIKHHSFENAILTVQLIHYLDTVSRPHVLIFSISIVSPERELNQLNQTIAVKTAYGKDVQIDLLLLL